MKKKVKAVYEALVLVSYVVVYGVGLYHVGTWVYRVGPALLK